MRFYNIEQMNIIIIISAALLPALILLVPVLSHDFYDTFAMSGQIDEYVGAFGMLVLIYFCFKMHKLARRKVLAMIEKDKETIVS